MEQRFKHYINQPTMRRHLTLLLIGIAGGLLIFSFINFDESQNTFQKALSGFLGVLVAYATYYSNIPLNALLDWKRFTGVRLLLGILCNTVGGFILIGGSVWGYRALATGTPFSETLSMEQRLKLGILLFCAAIIYNVVYFAFYSYNQYTTAQLKALKAEREQAAMQLATLKAQLSPHFLFNCINSLSVLFHDHVAKAEGVIRAMAKLYQYTLTHCRDPLISVKEEMEFVQAYAFVLNTRFGDAFSLDVRLDPEHLETQIPPLTLQLLLENAVKHNVGTASEPIQVVISGQAASLQVRNTKNPIKHKKPSTGVGLRNIQGRYRLLSKAKIRWEDADDFTVTLPLLFNE